MEKNRTKLAARNLVFGMVNKIVMLIVPFFLLAVIERTLGSEYLGINNLFASLLQMLNLTEMGFGSAMVYFMYKPVVDKNVFKQEALLKFYRTIYRTISIIIFVIGVAFIPFLPKLIKGTVPNGMDINLLFIIFLLNTVFSYGLFAYKKSLIQAHQRTDLISKISTIVHIFLYITQFLVIIFLKNYYLYVILLPISTIVDNLFINHFCAKEFGNIRTQGLLDKETKKDIFKQVRALAGHKIGAIVINSFDSIVISAFLGLRAVALYSNYFYIIKALAGIINIGYSSLLPGIGNSILLENREHNYSLYKKISFILMWFVGWAAICLICIYQPFITLWMGDAYLLGWDTVLLFVIYFYVWQIRVVNLAFKDAAGLWTNDFWKPYIGLFVNLVVNIILVKYIGMNGVLITTIFVMIVIYNPWEQYVLFTKLFKCNAIENIKNHFFHIILTIIIAAMTYFVCNVIHIDNVIITILIRICICIVLPNIIFAIIYRNKIEFKYLLNLLLGLLRKIGININTRKNNENI